MSESPATPDAAAEPAPLFTIVRRHFERVAAESSVVDRHVTIGGHSVRLRFADATLVSQLTPAFAHLETAAVPHPRLTINVWQGDRLAPHEEIGPPRWEDVAGVVGPGPFLSERMHIVCHGLTLSLWHGDEAYFWIRDGGGVALSDIGAPLVRILHWWGRRWGLQLVHGGAIGFADGGVLLAGKGGAGKSTTSLAALDSALQYAADDYCLVAAEPRPFVHSLYCTGKVHRHDLHRFPSLTPVLSNPVQSGDDKALFFLHPRFGPRLTSGFPLQAIVVPQVTGHSDTTFSRLPARAGVLALAPNTIAQLPGASGAALATVSAIARQVPTYALRLGTDIAAIPAAIAALLDECRSRPPALP